MFNPVSTYRIQFHKGFTFADFELIIPYLEQLGISTIYASPIFQSTPGSMHGYDGINPVQINKEIGSLDQLRTISRRLQEKNIGWVQDIVPNHMAFHAGNEWLMDLLEKGNNSTYKSYFDQSLSSHLFKGPIMVPFLGESLEAAVNALKIELLEKDDKLYLAYAEQRWPVNIKVGEVDISAINQDKSAILKIANEQYYRLCSWEESDTEINFRRFFTVNSLICLNMQNEEVFKNFHGLILQLLQEGVFDGLRIDHVDGLYDPANYLKSLRALAGTEAYIVVEKILGGNEQLPVWPIQGTTGYEFLAEVNNLLTNRKSEATFNKMYAALTGENKPVKKQILDKKAYILSHHMQGELDNLAGLFATLHKGRVAKEKIKGAIALFLIHCPVYRFYGNEFPLKGREADQVRNLFSVIKAGHEDLRATIDELERAILGKNDKYLEFYMRCMQFTGPLMAKGVEDTLMYTYERFSAHNEVGDAPGAFGITTAEFDELMVARQKAWPLALNASATHDTKRGEDVRARLNILPDIADEWHEKVGEWRQLNLKLKQVGAPDANDEYLIYQTLIGAYPMPGEKDDNFKERLLAYLEKTMREAKLHSDWAKPNEGYESAVKKFAESVLDKKKPFWDSFSTFHYKVADFGVVNSLVQVLLKFTCPGVPDVYQGCEHWDLSLVDPDNRRPVNFDLRAALLKDLHEVSTADLWKNRFNGQIKLWLVHTLLQERKNDPLLFSEGEFVKLKVKGKYQDHVYAFARKGKRCWLVSVIPLGLAALCKLQNKSINKVDWGDTNIILPDDAPGKFKCILQKTAGEFKKQIEVQSIFAEVPVALIKLEQSLNPRGSGLLMHISSLPSQFGIGDFGPQARAFADMLHRCDQKYWQLLPLSPIEQNTQYSPYSSFSSMAGNVLFISPELMVPDGLLAHDEVASAFILYKTKVDFRAASEVKDKLFATAWKRFNNYTASFLHPLFKDYCIKEAFWLNDFALYVVVKQYNGNRPWYEWPKDLKLRSKKALTDFENQHREAICKVKWLQFLFSRQWSQLRKYCNKLDIKIFGDLPFYVSYDSVDVWAHPDIFSLDKKGNVQFVAGVPPDYFAKDGQLWGMPVFRWDKLKSQGYQWWVQRFKKNFELFDLLRLDHFRAFSSYWVVPAGESTAVNGNWEYGPGTDFFNTLKENFGVLPLMAEDLGDIDENVYKIRDEFALAGMRVLQFAFGRKMACSPHIPHNYTVNSIAYTGTHDNNTVKGWYNKEVSQTDRKQIKDYTGIKIKAKNVHKVFIRTVMASVAKIAIIPVQDLLGLDEGARMNTPAVGKGSWLWRVKYDAIGPKVEKRLKKWTMLYNRQ